MFLKFTTTKRAIGTLVLGALFVSSTGFSQTNVYDDVIATSSNHTYLKAALDQEGYDVILQNNAGTFTVFAPDNDAFTNLANALQTDITGLLGLADLADILEYHVLNGLDVTSSMVTNGQIVTPLNNANTLKMTKTSTNAVYANQAMVNGADLSRDNGTVHSIDAVLLPWETVVDVAIDNNYTSLVAAVIEAELLPALTNPLAELTVFAPTNDAFTDLATALETDINGLLASPDLADILTYHVIGEELQAVDIDNGDLLTPLNNANTVKMTKTSMGTVYANQAEVNIANLGSDNGTVHSITSVILPVETVVDIAIDNNYTSLTTAVIQEELLPALTNPFSELTVFAPTNDAFDALAANLNTDINGLLASPDLTDILTYHVLGEEFAAANINNGDVLTPLNNANTVKMTKTSMGTVYANHAEVNIADLGADNGTVHSITDVILPVETVIDVALDNNFNYLATAVIQQELIPALTNPFDTVTVFAPTDQAFTDLATALNTDINGILSLSYLTEVLLYHVVGGNIQSGDLTNGDVTMLNGQDVTIDLSMGVMVNSSNVTGPDNNADNGVVHIIDAVLVPVVAGVEENEMEVSVYPTVSQDFINLNFTDSDSKDIQLISAAGQVIYNAKSNSSSETIDLSNFSNGTYVLKIQSKTGLFNGRVIKK